MAEKKKNKKTNEGKSLKESIDALSRRKKVGLSIFIAISVTALIFLFAFAFIAAVTPEELTEEEFDELISILEGREWMIESGDKTKLSSYMYGLKAERITTERNGDSLIIYISSSGVEVPLRFSYIEGRVMGFISSTLFYLYHSSSRGKTNHVLTLINKEQKIVLYENV